MTNFMRMREWTCVRKQNTPVGGLRGNERSFTVHGSSKIVTGHIQMLIYFHQQTDAWG